MRQFSSKNVFAQYRGSIKPDTPVLGRRYTVIRSDTAAEIFVIMGESYAEDIIMQTCDRVKIAWEQNEDGFYLAGSVAADEAGILDNSFRNNVLLREMPDVLRALRQADRFLFYSKPALDSSPVLIHFISGDPEYNQVYDFGRIGKYEVML